MTSAKTFAITLSVALFLSSISATASQKAPVTVFKAATIMINSIVERASRERGQSAQLNQLFQIELAKVNSFLQEGQISRAQSIELREFVIMISKTIFNRQAEHRLHFVTNAATSEQIHNLVALSQFQMKFATGNPKRDREFNHRMVGLASVFHGQNKSNTKDVFANFVVENNHPVEIPAPRRSLLAAIRDAAVNAFRAVVPAKTVTEETAVADQANTEIAAEAVEQSILVGGMGPRTLHPETDRFGKVTARMGNRSPFCDGALSPDHSSDI